MGPLIPAIFAAVASVSTSTPTATASVAPAIAPLTDRAEAELGSVPLEIPADPSADDPGSDEPPLDDVVMEDEVPLTAEELALIATLTPETSTTSSTARPRFWLAPAPLPRPTQILPRLHIRESLSRSIAEAFEPHPTVVDTARRYVPGDSAAIRGQSGHRVALYMEGVPLHHALTPSRETPGFFTIDPWMLSEAMLERPGSLELSPRGAAGAIRLSAIAPRREPGFEAEAELAARSADRSTSTHVAASLAEEIGAIRVAAGYNDYRALRVATSSISHGGGYQREAVGARARLLGNGSPVELYGGFDFDRLLNIPRTDLGLPPITDRIQQRLLVFARATVGSDFMNASLLLARQAFLRRVEVEGFNTTIDGEAISYFLRASAELRVLDALTMRIGGLFETSSASGAAVGETKNTGAYAGLDVATDRLWGSAQVSVIQARSIPEQGESIDETRPLTQGGLRLSIFGPAGVRAGWTQGLYVPTIQDLVVDAPPRRLEPETSWSFELGPSLYAHDGWIELLGFYTIVKNAIEPERLASRRLVNIDEVRIIGVELTGGWYVIDRLRMAGSLAWSEGQDSETGAPVITFPSVTARASVRYDLGLRNAYLEAHVRISSDPFYVTSIKGAEPPASLSERAPTSFARFGLSGATDLGLGFRLGIALENVLDTPHRAPSSLVPGAGVDVRVALSYAFP